jgi:hypothetical protein
MASQPVNVAAPRLSAFAICDDVRTEQGGKLTIVGFYGKAMRVPTLPTTFPKLCFWAQFDSPSLRPNSVRVRLTSPSGNVVLETPNIDVPHADDVSAIPSEYRQANLVFQVAPMIVNEGGPYVVEYDFPGWPPYQVQFFVSADAALAT